jgi:hypothetical protein
MDRQAGGGGGGNPRENLKSMPAQNCGSGPGGRAIPGIGARADVPALRYKMSQWRNPLVPQSQRTLLRAHRYKSS